MDDIRQYILSVIAAALICSIVNGLITGKSAYSAVVKLISGLFLTITIIAPLTNIQLTDPVSYFDELSREAEAIASSGQLAADQERTALIKKKMEAFILDKAAEMNVEITVDIILDDELTVPQKVTLTGTVSPYSKRMLTQYIQENLGVAEEDQIWM